jgi:hypothetical protein
MPPAARAFWRRYYLLTVLLPAYALAVLYYGAAGLTAVALQRALAQGAPAGTALWLGGACLLGALGLSRLLEALALGLNGISRRRTAPAPEQSQRLTALQANPDLPLLTPVLLELGEVPFLANAGLAQDELWISTQTLRTTPDEQLQSLVAHEQAHAATLPQRWALDELTWLAAYPLCWLTAAYPVFWLAFAALQVSLWLRWQQAKTDRRETQADRRAAESVGREAYARALAAYLAPFEALGNAVLLKRRLRKLGLSPDEIGQLLASRYEITM